MKNVKMLGLAAVAVAALSAFIGASASSATVLCKSTPAAGVDCPDKNDSNHELDASVETSTLLKTAGGTTIATCSGGTMDGKIVNAGSTAATVTVAIEGSTWQECTTTITTLAKGSLEVHHIAGTDNGTVTSAGSEMTIKFLGVSCIFKSNNTDIGTLTGGNPATFDISATIPGISGGLCPTSGIWSGAYKFTTPSTTLDVAGG